MVFVIRIAKYTLMVTIVLVTTLVNLPILTPWFETLEVKATPSSKTQAKTKANKRLVSQSRSRLLDENREGLDLMWSKWYDSLEKLTEQSLKSEHLPEFSWFSPLRETKESNLKKIKTLSETLLIELSNPKITSLRNHYFELKEQIKADRIAAQQAAKDSYQAPDEDDAYFWQSHKGTYRELKRRKEAAIKEHKLEQQKLVSKCHDELLNLGIELTSQQVEQLFALKSGDLMLTLLSTFAQLNLLGDYVSEKMQEAQNDESYAYVSKQYYSVYVGIISLSHHIHTFTREKLLIDHLSRLDELKKRLEKVLENTNNLLKKEKAQLLSLNKELKSCSAKKCNQLKDEIGETKRYIEQLKGNLVVQKRAQEGALAYRKYIIHQSREIKKTAQKISRRLKIAFNTYQTVNLGTNEFDLMKEGLRDLSNLQKIRMPAMVPLAGERITNHLDMLTRHFNGEDALAEDISLTKELKR